MDDREVAEFLATERTVIIASNGRDGWPHVMPLWYIVRDGEVWVWTYAASQKVRNLEACDAHATLQIEASAMSTRSCARLMIKAEATIERRLRARAWPGARAVLPATRQGAPCRTSCARRSRTRRPSALRSASANALARAGGITASSAAAIDARTLARVPPVSSREPMTRVLVTGAGGMLAREVLDAR